MWGSICRKYVLSLIITGVLISLSAMITYGAVPYDRAAARDEACTNNFHDDSFRGNSDGRYSPTYVATVMDAGGITIATPPSSVLGYSVIQNWMRNNEDDWTFVAS